MSETMEEPVGEVRRRNVTCHVTFLKIGEINTLKEQFDADVLIRSKWREPELDNYDIKAGTVDWTKLWHPMIAIENFVMEPKITVKRAIEKGQDGAAYVVEMRREKGSFLEQLELWDFPFDVQDLSVTLMSDRPTSEIRIKDDPDEVHKLYKQSFIDEQEWHLYKYVTSEIVERLKDKADPTARCLSLTATCRAARRPAFYISNILSVTFLIVVLGFTTFAVKPDLVQNRLQLTFTLVLTSVAFKFVVQQSLPRVSYLTYLDQYILATMLVLTLICLWDAIQTIIPGAFSKDYIALIVIASIYIIYNISFICKIVLDPYKKRRQMNKLEIRYTKTVQAQVLRNKVVPRQSNFNKIHPGGPQNDRSQDYMKWLHTRL